MYVSVRDCMLPVMGKADPCEALAALGLSAVELTVARPTSVAWVAAGEKKTFSLAARKDVAALKAALSEQKVMASALLMANDFSSDDFEGEVKALTVTCQAAEQMGVPAVRIDLVPHKGGMPEDQFVERCADATRRAIAACSDVDLAIENHGSTSNRPEFLEKVFGATGEKRLGLTLDTGNFYWYGHPLKQVYAIMEKYADRVYHTHVKNISYPAEMRNTRREVGYKYGEYVCPIYEGDVDHKRVVAILEKVGYARDLCIEDEGLGKFSEAERRDVLVKDAQHLKSLV